MDRRNVAYSIIRPSDWPWGMAILFALGSGRYELAPERPEGEYVGTAPVPIIP